MAAILEELVWLLSISGCVLADSGEGETPMVPVLLSMVLKLPESWGPDPVEALSTAVLQVASLCLDGSVRSVVSPR